VQTSVLTLVRGRRAQLTNLMRGLALQSSKPAELVIAWMQPEPFEDLPDPGCQVRHVMVQGDALPLAKARNQAAEASKGDFLIFLDVDCIPEPGLVAAYEEARRVQDGLFLGEVLYLLPGAASGALDFARLDQLGVPHPSKPPMPSSGVRLEPDVGQLWGLSFALGRQSYLAVGGMSELFEGYGGEETDFATRLGMLGLPFFWTAGARCYHQHHPISVPPLQHFDAILRNATLFHERHGRWCMDYWLGQFQSLGLIAWSIDAPEIALLREPTSAEIAMAASNKDRVFS
jgi:N-acetylglucosaminyl-diphospho-decaprenol L-rhamnosyltransferase